MSTVAKPRLLPNTGRGPMPFGQYQTSWSKPNARTGHIRECCCSECLACACGAPFTYGGTSKCWDCHVTEKGLEGARSWASDMGALD